MHGRRLATTERIIAVRSPESETALAELEAWTESRGLELAVIDVGEDIGDAYDENTPTLGVTLGGDGTFLEGIKTFAPRGVPLLGVNTGTLAFLARVEPDDLSEALDAVLRGHATVDSRQQLRIRARGLDTTGINELMIRHVPPENPINRKVTRLNVFADEEYVGEFEGTGLAVSTPTGSTGISLSAGGPIHYPVDNQAIQLVPLHTHRMGVRPVVVAPSTELRILTQGVASLLVDGGRTHTVLGEGEIIRVTGSDQLAHVVRTDFDDHFFTAITKKLGWGVRGETETGPTDRLDGAVPKPEPGTVERALSVAMEAAESVGEPLRELHGRVESVTYKSDKADIVTEADNQANRIITTVIENEFPEHGILSEEGGGHEGSGEYLWVIDPLDGTGNFAHGNPNYSVSIALLHERTPVMGVVYVPETDELFSAIEGEEPKQNGTGIDTTTRDSLDESMLLSGYDPDGTFLSHFYQETRGVRRLGSAALHLCYLASGSADAVWEYDTHPWDVAAGLVIARAAGATITDGEGNPYELTLGGDSRQELLGSNGPLHPALLEHLSAADSSLRI